MANEQYAFLYKKSVPSKEAWQAAIDESGFDLKLDPELKPFEDSGFSPATLMGRESGVEIYYDGSKEHLEEFSEIAQGRDFCISFRWGGAMDECACAMIASYALAKKFGAIVSYEGEDPYTDLDAFLKDTRSVLEDVRKGS